MRKLNNQSGQEGFVSIIVTLIIMIVLTLIVLSFAQLSRREQRNALDRQLSTQAFYAAESGINDYLKVLSTLDLSIPANQQRTDCNAPPPVAGMDNVVNATNKVVYSCVLYDTTPSSLKYDNITNAKLTIVPISNTDLKELKINWGNGSNFRPKNTTLPAVLTTKPNWGGNTPGLLRVMLIPRRSISRNDYINGTFNGWLYPATGGAGTLNFNDGVGSGNSGILAEGNCLPGNTPNYCNMQITDINASNKGWYLVLLSVYTSPETVVINCVTGDGKNLCKGSQVVIDATGKAQDVIRRVQVRKPLLPDNNLPIGFQSVNSICKQIVIAPPNVTDVGEFFGSPACPAF